MACLVRLIASGNTNVFFFEKISAKSEYLIGSSMKASLYFKKVICIRLVPMILAICQGLIFISKICKTNTWTMNIFNFLSNATLTKIFLSINSTRFIIARSLAVI